MDESFARCDGKYRKLIIENKGARITIDNEDAMLVCNYWNSVAPPAQVFYVVADYLNGANVRRRASDECQRFVSTLDFKGSLEECGVI